MYTKAIVQTIAKQAIRDMLESHVEMMADEPQAGYIGDITQTIREITLDYIEDLMNDMKHDVVKEIEEMKFIAKIEATLKFNDE